MSLDAFGERPRGVQLHTRRSLAGSETTAASESMDIATTHFLYDNNHMFCHVT
jgi:hypothetical protein